MNIYLAPMEGLADHHLRRLLTQVGGYDLVITEFVRVVDQKLPEHVFLTKAPELNNFSQTECGTPVRIQLLGNHPQALAENADRAIEMGSQGVDLNFGCPSKTVNKSKGGAILLKEPEALYQIVKSVNEAVPEGKTLSAKMRLGYEDDSLLMECADAIASGGAKELTVHARTKVQAYKPPAYWHLVEAVQKRLSIPIIINGDIWSSNDAVEALKQSGASHVMLGRGAIQNPWLASNIKAGQDSMPDWQEAKKLVLDFWQDISMTMSDKYCSGRLKQWLNHLQNQYPEAKELFKEVRKLTEIESINKTLRS